MFIISSVERHYIHYHELYIILPHFIVTLYGNQSVTSHKRSYALNTSRTQFNLWWIQWNRRNHLYCARRVSV